MIRRLGTALCLSLFLLVAGCNGNDDVTGSPSGSVEPRTLASMLPSITKSLTPPLAEQIFGPPNNKQGSGQVIYVYNVEDGKKVNLSFPGLTAPITFASLQDRNGVTTPLPILD